MAFAARSPGALRAVIFDLDDTLLVRDRAWQYAVEEAVISVTGRRVQAAPLAFEYRNRPWRHALDVVLQPGEDRARCETLCAEMYRRSAMKRLLIHDGLGMALDKLRGERVEMGAVSREPHAIALKQVQSTGLDRFLAVLAATPAGDPWDATTRIGACLAFLEREPRACAFVSGDRLDLTAAGAAGLRPFEAIWAGNSEAGPSSIESPAGLTRAILRRS